MYDYYDNYSKYQTRLKEILKLYRKSVFLLLVNNSFLKLTNV